MHMAVQARVLQQSGLLTLGGGGETAKQRKNGLDAHPEIPISEPLSKCCLKNMNNRKSTNSVCWYA